MGSIGAGFIAGADYGLWIGLVLFLAIFIVGVMLHKIAESIYSWHIECNPLCHKEGLMIDNEQDISILKYVGLFALVYFILRLAASIFLSMVHAEYYKTVLIIGVSASLSAFRFIEENDRILSKTERTKLIIGTFLCVILINASYLLRERMIFGDGIGPRFIADQVLDLFILWLVFGPVSKDIYKRRQKR
ncbi:MAG TPA: ABZJ_00895 family protein [Nitrospirota bacterium]|nr:ABZJ_00895 family protein [Nitrospirota bacterium]